MADSQVGKEAGLYVQEDCAMRIANNILAMTAYRNYTQNMAMVGKAMERLSSGYRINSAADDPAGLAISENMRAQIRGLNRAAQNVLDAKSMMQTAEGDIDSICSILQRMNELSVQAATGTLSDFDRLQASKEFEQLKREINDIAGASAFNGMNLLDNGSMASSDTVGIHVAYEERKNADGTMKQVSVLEFNPFKLVDGDEIRVKLTAADGTETDHFYTYRKGDTMADLTNGLNLPDSQRSGFQITADGKAEVFFKPSDSRPKPGDLVYKIQTGALEGQRTEIRIPILNTNSLGLDGVSIDTQEAASKAITAVKKAQEKAVDARTTLGAMQNRFDHKYNNLKNQALNLAEAESRIRDADIAEEMMNLVQAQMRVQLSAWVIAQSNTMAQRVLELLMG